MITRVGVELGARRYDIAIGPGLLRGIGSHLAVALGRTRAVVITDDLVAPHYLAPCIESMQGAGISVQALTVPAGEASKSWACLGELLDRMLGLGLDRKVVVVALGGGVIGDLAGFAAAICLRGLAFVQVPTTLLAQVDSSVGGKTGINAPAGKNLIGAFYQPQSVLADTDTLTTLPPRQRRAGYAEIAKYGAIDRPDFFTWLEAHGPKVIAGDQPAQIQAIAESCRAKAEIVAADEREGGRRALLNLGHTFGHALEAELGYDDRLIHGEAVAIGMVLAFDLSVRLGHCPPAEAGRLERHLAAMGLPTRLHHVIAGDWPIDRLVDHMGRDKKVEAGQVTFILARGIGQAFIDRRVPMECVRRVLEASCLSQSPPVSTAAV